MRADFKLEVIPLGLRLLQSVRALLRSTEHSAEWSAALQPVLERIARAPLARPDRFERVEADGLREVEWPGRTACAGDDDVVRALAALHGHDRSPRPDEAHAGQSAEWSAGLPPVPAQIARAPRVRVHRGERFEADASWPRHTGFVHADAVVRALASESERDRPARPDADHAAFALPVDTHRAGAAVVVAARAPHALPGDVLERLRPYVGDAAQAIKVHDDEHADHLARQHRAQAVSMGADVYFARGRYKPHDAHGFALLAHEAVHVAHASRDDAAAQRTSARGLSDEEALAAAVEADALRFTTQPGRRSGRPARSATPAPSAPVARSSALAPAWPSPARSANGAAAHGDAAPTPSPAPAARPMTAAIDRALPAPPPASPPTIDMESLRQTLMRDLMNQIRTDMERGG